ncbi:gliding motility-associated C-terminal domain-containing protein [Pedobacter sp. ASV1-7]|uniref:gliding motility-associated C-terminal domain-containing protein n=1 Tax=Pedobacter sp. ASV1-7 TaxID=3145237 RepID=UPI0032E87649
MRYSKYAILLLLIFSAFTGYAQNNIQVTNNGDTGPGTLRQALLDAANNGTVTKDIITFNLPNNGAGSNIIRLRSQLPVVTTNVTIDGTTQGGPPLGVSGAKVIIEPELPLYSGFSGLIIGSNPYVNGNIINVQTTDVEIYGLYLRKFAIVNSLQPSNQISGIIIDYRVDRIQIGAAGKGNVIGGNTNGILLRNNSGGAELINKQDQISIQGNLIGVTDDGYTHEPNVSGINGDISFAALSIGGDAVGDGNVIAANGTDINLTRQYYTTLPMLLNIFNNKIGTDFSGTRSYKTLPLFSGSSAVQMTGIKVNAGNTTVNISKNIVSGHITAGIIITNSIFLINGNHIGVGTVGTETSMGNGAGIRLEGSANGTIGGTADPDPNLIGYNRFGIESVSTGTVKIMRNSIYCNSEVGIAKVTSAPQAYIQVLKINPNYITGKANAGSEIELFYTDDCPGSCQGKTYFATVRAGSDGRWRYDGPIAGQVTGTATMPGAGITSQFSTAGLLPNEGIKIPVTCNGLGSVTIAEEREGITFEWYKLEADGTEGLIGSTQSKDGLDVGSYEVRINDGCYVSKHRFDITDQIMTELIVTTPIAQCGENDFTFTASVYRGMGTIKYEWTNAAGALVGRGPSVRLPEGTYTVTATDDAGCPKTHTFPFIERRKKPRIVPPSSPNWSARCGLSDGLIRGITVADTEGTVTYKWYNYNNVTGVKGAIIPNATTADLDDVAGGYYLLEVTDGGSCSPAVPYIAFVRTTKSVIIKNGTPRNTTCNNNNGAILGVTIEEGNTWKLTTAAGAPVADGVCNPNVPFDIPNLPAGNFVLNASNTTTLCAADPRPFTILPTQIVQYVAQVRRIGNASCGDDNGSISLFYPNNIKPLTGRYFWENEAGVPFTGTSELITGLPEGKYTLRITDPNGCTSPSIGPFEVIRIPLIIVDQTSGRATDDVCGLERGTIAGVLVTGGLPSIDPNATYTYTWKKSTGEIVSTDKDYTKASKGIYYLEVTDQASCTPVISQTFTVDAPVIKLPTPLVNNIRVCYATEIMLPVVAPDEGVYQMYVSEDDARPLLETSNGRFIFKVSKTGDYLIRRKLGDCYSDFTSVHIEVTNDNLEIKNTMTPNGDGMNDYWSITGLPDHADINIKVYARSGQLVYESVGAYSKPFDGRFRGVELPNGAYYYRIDLRADCNPIAGSITLLR